MEHSIPQVEAESGKGDFSLTSGLGTQFQMSLLPWEHF